MQGNGIGEVAQDLVIRAFGRHDITLHIDVRYAPANKRLACILGNKFPADDGCKGGGGSLGKHDSKFIDSVESALYANNNYGSGSNTGFDKSSRSGIFHYCV
ncbi:hypothetical protein B6U83_05265, partial [Thermoplasmatales archaeon ex4484_36]